MLELGRNEEENLVERQRRWIHIDPWHGDLPEGPLATCYRNDLVCLLVAPEQLMMLHVVLDYTPREECRRDTAQNTWPSHLPTWPQLWAAIDSLSLASLLPELIRSVPSAQSDASVGKWPPNRFRGL